MKTLFMEEMSWPEIGRAIESGIDSVLLPLGAMEQHGPHLPLFTDTWLGYALCGPIAGKVGNMLVAPPVYPGRSDHHMAFAGSLTLSHETFKSVVRETAASLASHGFRNLVLIATHGGNQKALNEVVPVIQSDLPDVRVLGIEGAEAMRISLGVNEHLGLDQDKAGRHAALTETSMLLATRPELVHMEWAEEGWMGGYGPSFGDELSSGGMQAFSQYGILGDPRESTAGLGREILEERACGYALLIRQKLGLSSTLCDLRPAQIGRHDLDKSLLLEELTSRQIAEAIDAGWDSVCVLLGSIEQHGPHLPIGTDTMLGYERGVRLARALGKTLVAPVIRPGLSKHHMAFPGSLTLRPEAFAAMVMEFCAALAEHGFRRVILMPTHGGNYAISAEILPKLQQALPDVTVILLGREDSRAFHSRIQPDLGLDPQLAGVHSGLMETSLMLAHRPDLVHMEDAAQGWIGDFDEEGASVLEAEGTHALSSIGVLGDPREASVDLGETYLEAWTAAYCRVVREKSGSDFD